MYMNMYKYTQKIPGTIFVFGDPADHDPRNRGSVRGTSIKFGIDAIAVLVVELEGVI
jgi:hypothetical protein